MKLSSKNIALSNIAKGHLCKRAGIMDTFASYMRSSGDNIYNTGMALRRGQVPIPWLTIGPSVKNKPFDVKKGDPVYFGMMGAGPYSDYKNNFGFGNSESIYSQNPSNTHLYSWFERAQAERDLREFMKNHPDNPVYAFGESYGGTSIQDVIRNQEKSIDGLVTYDPVGWFGGESPRNVKTRPVNIQPVYADSIDQSNIIARMGGRRLGLKGTDTKIFYGPGGNAKNPRGDHYLSAVPTSMELIKKTYQGYPSYIYRDPLLVQLARYVDKSYRQ